MSYKVSDRVIIASGDIGTVTEILPKAYKYVRAGKREDMFRVELSPNSSDIRVSEWCRSSIKCQEFIAVCKEISDRRQSSEDGCYNQ